MDHHAATGPAVSARWWGPATTLANADVMNQLCRVCGEPAAGFHFGAFTCEGCKSFFGRTYNNLNSVSECKNNGECVINKKNRTSCKACRLRNCLLVGMSKSGSRYGRRSNWFKIHCLLQEQQLQHQQQHSQQLQPNQHPATASLPAKRPWEYAKNATTLLDIDNNNTMIEHAMPESPPATFTSSHDLSKTSESGSFWATRHPSLTVPHQHALPYFISPFLQTPLQSVTHNYLLPFLPIRPPHPLEPLVTSSTPPASLHSSPSPLIAPTKEAITPEDTDKMSLQKLRSLGPVQDQPIDLSSSKVVEKKSVSINDENNVKVELSHVQREDEKQSKNDKVCMKSTIPLDLRCSKS